MKNELKNKQHFVPRLLLKKFANKAMQIGSLDLDKFFDNPASYGSQCYEIDYYTKFEQTNEYEDFFEKEFETPFSVQLNHFFNTREITSAFVASAARFCLLQAIRTPIAYQRWIEIEESRRHGFLRIGVESVGDFIYSANTQRNFGEIVKRCVCNFEEIARNSNLIILKASKYAEFYLSDHPVSFLNKYLLQSKRNDALLDVGFYYHGYILIMPISPDYCILLYDKEIYRNIDSSLFEAKIELVNQINHLLVSEADKKIFFNFELKKNRRLFTQAARQSILKAAVVRKRNKSALSDQMKNFLYIQSAEIVQKYGINYPLFASTRLAESLEIKTVISNSLDFLLINYKPKLFLARPESENFNPKVTILKK